MKTPECDKLAAVSEETQKIREFLDWIESEMGLELCGIVESHKGEPYFSPTTKSKETILAKFFDIDLNKLEKERRKILQSLRS